MIFQYQNNNLLAQRQHKHPNDKKSDIVKLLNTYTSVDTEMCCPKGKCGCQYFILLTLKKKNSWTQWSWIFLIKINPGLLFLLKVRPCVFISNFHHSPPPPPKGYKIVSLIIN
jgi:hypothetical protein